MRKLSFFSLLTGTLMLIAACGNDPEVEARFVSTVEKGITILDSAQTVADLVEAEDSIDKAFSIEGATELSETGAVKDVMALHPSNEWADISVRPDAATGPLMFLQL